MRLVSIRSGALSAIAGIALTFVLAPVARAAEPEPGQPAAPEFRPDPGEPRRLPQSAFFKPEIYIPSSDPANAASFVLQTLSELGLSAEVVSVRSWLEPSYPPPSKFDFDRAIVIAVTGIPHGRSTHRAHIEIIPMNSLSTVAIKYWEACAPSLAPSDAERAWHPCGAPTSRAYKAVIESLNERMALADGGAIH